MPHIPCPQLNPQSEAGRLTKSDLARSKRALFKGALKRGHTVRKEIVTIDQLAEMVMEIAGKKLTIKHIPGPLGVRGRNSDNKLIGEKLGWKPSMKLIDGISRTYPWIKEQVEKAKGKYRSEVSDQRTEVRGQKSEGGTFRMPDF